MTGSAQDLEQHLPHDPTQHQTVPDGLDLTGHARWFSAARGTDVHAGDGARASHTRCTTPTGANRH